MPITIKCVHCGKTLSVPDKAIGKRVKCPSCGGQFEVDAPPAEEGISGEKDLPRQTRPPADLNAPEQEPEGQFAAEKDLPPPLKQAEGYEGEDYDDVDQLEEISRKTRIGHGTFEVGEVISRGWAIFKSQMGLIIGVVVVSNILQNTPAIFHSITDAVADNMAQNNQHQMSLVIRLFGFVFTFIQYALMFYLVPGQTLVLLKICKGKKAEFGDLFRGGRYFGRMFLSSIVLGLMVVAGLILCIIPGIIVGLMFGMYTYALVDQDAEGIDSLWRSKEATQGNLGSIFVLGLALFGINLLGALACCVGLIFTGPLTYVVYTVAYLRMTEQRVVRVN